MTRPSPSMRRALALGGVVVLVALHALVLEMSPPAPFVWLWMAVFLPGVFFVSWIWWRSLDEAAQEAHKFAWFWGGSLGLAVAILVGALVLSAVPELLIGAMPGWRSPADYMLGGMTIVVAGQMIGYLLAWAGWWIARR